MALFRLRAFRENAKGSHKTQATASCGGYASTTSMALFRLRAFRENAKGSHKTQLAACPQVTSPCFRKPPAEAGGQATPSTSGSRPGLSKPLVVPTH